MSIKFKLMLTIDGLIAITLLMFGFLIYTSEKQLLLKQVSINHQTIVDSLLEVANESLLSEDDLMLISYTLGLKKNINELEFAYVKSDKTILAHTDKKLIRSRPQNLNRDVKNILLYKKKITANSKNYEAVAGFSELTIEKKIYQTLDSLLLRIFKISLIVLSIATLLVLWLSYILTMPIKKLGNALKKVGEGNLDCFLKDDSRKDEIGVLNRGFNKMILQLKELDEMKKDFVSSVTHELKSPLSAIESYLNIMLYDIKQSLANQTSLTLKLSKFIENINFVKQNSSRLLNFITALLDTSKIEKGKFEINKTKTAIAPLIKDVLNLFAEKAKTLNIELAEDFSNQKIPDIFIDAERIRQVLINLISNAINYTCAKGKVMVKTSIDSDNFLKVCVKDTGAGIPKDHLNKIFDKFSQIKSSRSLARDHKGTGLGLYITKTIIEAHGGFIYAESAKQKGSQFIFKLPINLGDNNDPTTPL
ncbi:MAG: HAMP domain-containing histidine kinase [Elusimicrobia bacterium]|nr:HAMP domain-containing histidine kinase [Elusimicrobiota bacterium]